VIENQKERAENFDDESDMIDAFVACGGDVQCVRETPTSKKRRMLF
jgi:hypothetical protein